jgi:3-hydroxymyristoyl/3-hydroxydecanoyl-(acyl carrier protein) dehydratase
VRVDGVLDCIPGESTTTFYRVRKANTEGHFDVMPGKEIIEAAGQAGAYAIMIKSPGELGVLLDEVRDFKFSSMVLTGETITCEAVITDQNGDVFVGQAIVKVDGLEVAKGSISGTLTKIRTIEKGPALVRRKRRGERAEAIAAGVHPHEALAPRE